MHHGHYVQSMLPKNKHVLHWEWCDMHFLCLVSTNIKLPNLNKSIQDKGQYEWLVAMESEVARVKMRKNTGAYAVPTCQAALAVLQTKTQVQFLVQLLPSVRRLLHKLSLYWLMLNLRTRFCSFPPTMSFVIMKCRMTAELLQLIEQTIKHFLCKVWNE